MGVIDVLDRQRRGAVRHGRSHDIMQWLEGTGAYEGWSYVAVLSDLDRPDTEVRGVVYRGDLPPSVRQELVLPAE